MSAEKANDIRIDDLNLMPESKTQNCVSRIRSNVRDFQQGF